MAADSNTYSGKNAISYIPSKIETSITIEYTCQKCNSTITYSLEHSDIVIPHMCMPIYIPKKIRSEEMTTYHDIEIFTK